MLWRNPLVLAYFIPVLGWLPLAIKGYRDNKLARLRKAPHYQPASQP
jgi:hypothetical protein